MIGGTTSGYIWQYYGNQTDGQYQLHTYITEVVTYFAEQFLGCSTNGNLCAAVGYSKSANGAFSMLFLRPDKIGVACGWDGHWDQHEFFRVRDSVNPNYTTVENSEYFDPYLNVANRVSSFNDRERLILLGGSVWNPDLALMKAALDATGVDYQYSYEFNAVHSFSSGWLDDAVSRTMALCTP
jgi:S-formylglutathione hydrolase FrmB